MTATAVRASQLLWWTIFAESAGADGSVGGSGSLCVKSRLAGRDLRPMSMRCRISGAARSISVASRQRRLGLDCQNGFNSSSTRSTSLPQKVLRNSKCPVTAMVLSFPGPWLLATGSGRADLTNVAYSQAVPVGRGQRRSRVKTARKTEFSSFVLSLFAILLSQDHRARVRSLRARCLDRGAPIHL